MTTQDLELDQERKDVGMAVDMYFACNAAVFILWNGLGFLRLLLGISIADCSSVVVLHEHIREKAVMHGVDKKIA